MMTRAGRRLLAALAAIGLCAVLGGCAVDVAAPAEHDGGDGHHLRYYGGPKSPMWPAG